MKSTAPPPTRRTIGGNDVRKNLVKQFNELRDQLDKLADDASFNGINLLRGDKLKLTFNETGTSTIDIQAKDTDGNRDLGQHRQRSASSSLINADFDSDTIDRRLLNGLTRRARHACARSRRPSAPTCRSCRTARTSPRT